MFNVQLTAESHARILELAADETEGNASAMYRKLVREALAARSSQLLESREAVAEAVASVRGEGLEPSAKGLEVLGQVATGEVAVVEAVEALVDHHTVETVLPIHAGQDVAQPSDLRSVPVVLPETVPAGYSAEERVAAGLEVETVFQAPVKPKRVRTDKSTTQILAEQKAQRLGR